MGIKSKSVNIEYLLDYLVFSVYRLDMKKKDEILDEIKKHIIESAMGRFAHYGFSKTTMAEIAKDCDMSAANLYRFFDSKAGIAAELAEEHFIQTNLEIAEVVKKARGNHSQALKGIATYFANSQFEFLTENPKILELVDFISNERMDLIEKKVSDHVGAIKAVLDSGNESGEFDIEDTAKTAEIVYRSLSAITFPPLAYKVVNGCGLPPAKLTDVAEEIIELIIKGLKKK